MLATSLSLWNFVVGWVVDTAFVVLIVVIIRHFFRKHKSHRK